MQEESVDERLYEQYLAGTGLAAHLLYKMIPAGADPLGPDNILCFLAGLLTGTGSLFAGRWMVAGKSPLPAAGGMRTAAAILLRQSNGADTTGSLSRGSAASRFIYMS